MEPSCPRYRPDIRMVTFVWESRFDRKASDVAERIAAEEEIWAIQRAASSRKPRTMLQVCYVRRERRAPKGPEGPRRAQRSESQACVKSTASPLCARFVPTYRRCAASEGASYLIVPSGAVSPTGRMLKQTRRAYCGRCQFYHSLYFRTCMVSTVL